MRARLRFRSATLLTVLVMALVPACAAPAAPPGPPAGTLVQASGPLRQTASEVDATVASLRLLDDHPLYEMTFHGGYDATAPLQEEDLAADAPDWGCSLVHLPGPEPQFARNFDWDPSAALVVHADPPDGYASVAIVDLFYLLGHRGPVDVADPVTRRRLAHGVLAPFDGMNEAGLVVGMAGTPDAAAPPPAPNRSTVGSVRIIRLILDRAATVDEAVEVMRRHSVDFTGGPQIHYLIADATGRSAVVEYAHSALNVIDDRILTNIAMTGTTVAERMADRRYRLLAEGSTEEAADGLELLRQVAQPHTRWSVAYEPASASARLVTSQQWDRVHRIGLRAVA
ncbi:hypothetical protein GCM10009609_54290 [Pseudonocardia aurantiaca]|uniref:Carcinine hydrolase/isopenicillin-N N-acyltransferase family protein n=1 Tax=Pseudonocardia aurantiaca TaxID=75290 RepID=A0ABW4FG73_9PSEU